jgi:hypothetical protein
MKHLRKLPFVHFPAGILYFSTALTLDQMIQRGVEVVGQEKRGL